MFWADQQKASAPLAGVDPLWSDPTTGGPEHSVLSKLRVANGSSPLGDLFHRLYRGRLFPAGVPNLTIGGLTSPLPIFQQNSA